MENTCTSIHPGDTVCACADYNAELIAATETRYVANSVYTIATAATTITAATTTAVIVPLPVDDFVCRHP